MYSYLDPLNLNNWRFFDNYVERVRVLARLLNLECLSLRVIRIERRDSLASSMNNSEESDVSFPSLIYIRKIAVL
jgi:hypothetical protein